MNGYDDYRDYTYQDYQSYQEQDYQQAAAQPRPSSQLNGLALYSRTETAAMLHISPVTLDKLVKAGKLPGRKIGRSWRFTEAAIMRYLNPLPGEGDQPRELPKKGWRTAKKDSE